MNVTLNARGVFVFAIAAAVLVATAPSAAAATPNDLASIHNTDTEFNNAQTLDNVQVEGSGTSASVTAKSPTIVDDFEDGDAVDTKASAWGDWSGDTGSFSADSSTTLSGSYSGKLAGTSGASRSVDITRNSGTTANFSTELRLDGQTGESTDGAYLLFQSGNNLFQIDFEQDGDILVENSDTGTDWSASTTYTVRVEWDFPNDQATVYVDNTDVGTYGLRQSASSWDGLSVYNDLSSSNSGVNLWIDDLAELPPEDSVYLSQTHDASRVEQAFVNVDAASGGSLTVEWQYYDGNNWQTAATNTYTTTGNKSVDVSGHATADKWRAKITYSRNTGSIRSDLSITDEGLEFDASNPDVDDSSLSPNGTQIQSTNPTLEAEISDVDFGTPQGDEVQVDFYVKDPNSNSFQQVGSDTLTSNGTAAYTYDATLGGNYEWYVIATDSYGDTTQSNTANFSSKGTLTIRNVSNISEIVDSPVEVTVRFFGDNITTKTTTTGQIDLSGLPVNKAFVVEIRPDQDYYERTVYIEDIISQDTVYVLNSSKSSVESRFELDDPTGEYGSNSIIFIQKPVNNSSTGTTEYVTVHADKFGVEGVTAILEQNARYRIKIKNEDGQAQIVGPYRADKAETVQVEPGNPQVGFGNYTNGWTANATINSNQIEYVYSDQFNDTTSLTVWVHEKGNTSNQLGPNQTYTNLGTASGTYSLTSNESETTWVVNFIVDRNGKQFTERVEVSNRPDLVPKLDREWRLIAAVLLMLISAGVFSMLNAGVGGVIVALEGGMLWYSGWLTGATSAAGITLALLVAGLAHVYTSRGP